MRHARQRFLLWPLAVVLGAAACGSQPLAPGGGDGFVDGGALPALDGGAIDAGAPPDGGAPDAGAPPDAGTIADGGAPSDGGAAPDAGAIADGGAVRVPLTDLGPGTYLGFSGALYPGGSNEVPEAHRGAALAAARAVVPLGTDGNPSSTGRYVLLSIGMSNTTQEFCSQSSALPCAAWSFVGLASLDPAIDRTRLEMVNGAAGGRSAAFWDSPSDPDYDRVRDTRLVPRGLSERQVQIVWVKVANPNPTVPLPGDLADAFRLRRQIGDILRSLKVRYPNVRLAFLSSRIYAGYATTTLNPEPYAYESAFAVKWVVEAQIAQLAGGARDAGAGDLGLDVAPLALWGPYLWADGENPRSDGLVWVASDFERDGTHPSAAGERKVATLLLDFFKGSPFTRCWFLAAGSSCE